MSITNVKYVLDDDGNNCQVKTTINGQQMYVPMSEDNRHWIDIQKWVADGNTIDSAD